MYQRSRRRIFLPFIVPALILYIIFRFMPLAQTVTYSFTNWQGHTMDRPFYGLNNYVTMTLDPQVRESAQHTIVFAISGALIMFVPAIFISWALTQKIKMKATLRYIIIAPQMLSVVAVSLLWKLLYNPVFGPINSLLKAIGLGSLALPWLGDPRTALIAVVLATAWHQLGMWVLLISAALERIPTEILEAARVDGASEWRVFWHVTMPMLWGVLRLLFILWIILSLQVFAQIYVMTPSGGAAGATRTVAILMYVRAFESYQWGLACAVATALMLVIFGLSMLTNRVTRRETVEY